MGNPSLSFPYTPYNAPTTISLSVHVTPMSWTDSYSRSPTRPNRPSRPSRSTYQPPHLRNSSNLNAPFAENPRTFGLPTESPGYRGQPSRGGGRKRGRGRGWGGRSWAQLNQMQTPYSDPNQNPSPNPFDVFEKFDELEVIEDTDTGNGINFDAYEDIPVEASGSDIPPPAISFAEIDLGKDLNDNIKRCKYVKPTPVQRHAIPVVLAGRDLMACAQTGSGKTAAFCFPIISGILRQNLAVVPGRQMRVASPVALILSPTRELSCQIYEEAKKFSYQTGVKVVVAYGGSPISQQLRNLEKGVDILVATPGRLVDMIERAKISLKRIKFLALDEADRMLDMGFERQIRKIVEQMEMPPPGARQTLLFSATFPTEIQRLASDFLSNCSSTGLIVQRVELVQDMDKRDHLMNLLRGQSSNNTNGEHALTIVFVETKRGADALEHWLCMNRFPATAIHGDKVQMERERALRSFKTGATPILVATDVAARGLDVPNVTHVINFDLPKDIDDYVHRIGRTGRAGKSGLATAFFSDKNSPMAKALVELMQESKQQVPSWLTQYAETSSTYGSGRANRYGGSKFGGHDFRSASSMSSGNNNYSSSYAGQVTFNEPYIDGGSGASTYSDRVGTGFSAASVDSYADIANVYGFDYGSVVATGWD